MIEDEMKEALIKEFASKDMVSTTSIINFIRETLGLPSTSGLAASFNPAKKEFKIQFSPTIDTELILNTRFKDELKTGLEFRVRF